MKKFFYLAFAAFAMIAIGCGDKDNEPDDGGNNNNNNGNGEEVVSIVGTWNLHHDDDFATLVLNDDNTYLSQSATWYKEAGTYTFENNILTLTPTQAWEREFNGGEYTEWHDVTPPSEASARQVRILYEGDVLLIKDIDDHSGEEEVVWIPYVNENATHVSNLADIQGKWRWQTNRVIININGAEGDIIISPWGERYKGTVRYEKGVIYMDNPTFYTTRFPDDVEQGWVEHMNDEDPEGSEWRLGGENTAGPSFGMLSIGFVVEGNLAYGGVANLAACFVKE